MLKRGIVAVGAIAICILGYAGIRTQGQQPSGTTARQPGRR